MLDFWRIVLDEAQMIEPARQLTLANAINNVRIRRTTTAQIDSSGGVGSVGVAAAAKMLEHIPSPNRWCVSGTPLRSSLMDLFPLLRFMRVAPFDGDFGARFGHVLGVWSPARRQPYGKLWIETAASMLMSRVRVEDTSIGVPGLDYDVIRVPLSPMEEANYQDLFRFAESGLLGLLRSWQ